MRHRVRDDETERHEAAEVGETGRRHARADARELVDVATEHDPAQPLADARPDESTAHLDETAAEEEHEGGAGEGRREAGLDGRVVDRLLDDAVEKVMDLMDGMGLDQVVDLLDEVVDEGDALRVDARRRQTHDLREARVRLGAGAVDAREADVGAAADAEGARGPVHRLADAPASRTSREGDEAHSADERALVGERSVRRRLVGARDGLVPLDGHVVWVGWCIHALTLL